MANATIAITGAGGFLGKALTALLKKNNFEVVSISRSYGIDITKAETRNIKYNSRFRLPYTPCSAYFCSGFIQ